MLKGQLDVGRAAATSVAVLSPNSSPTRRSHGKPPAPIPSKVVGPGPCLPDASSEVVNSLFGQPARRNLFFAFGSARACNHERGVLRSGPAGHSYEFDIHRVPGEGRRVRLSVSGRREDLARLVPPS